MFTSHHRLARRSSSTPRHVAVLFGTFATAIALTVSVAGVAQADTAGQTVFVNTGFTGPTAPGYIKPTAPTGTNVACLTASSATTATPIPGCASTAIDSAGSGALRLTSAGNTLEGGVGSTQSVPISKGLDASFDSYQYGGNGADGIVFYLAATDPYNPAVPTAIGQAGGSLGYSATGASAGLAHGYLGLGIDVYGNYLNSNFDGTGCSTAPGSSTQPSNVSVRGPGNGSAGYCVLPGYNSNIGGKSALEGATRAASDVPVEVIINPASTSTTSAGTSKLTPVTVAAMSYAIVFKTIGASTQTVVTGTLPDLRTSQYSGLFPSSWYDPATGLPYKLTYGWVASTGGSNDVHEVNYLNAQTVNGPVPSLSATSAVTNPAPPVGSTDSYSVSPSVAASGGSESEPVQVTTTFPTGTTPTAYSGTDYTCSISGQVETCTYTGTTAAGTSLPVLNLPFTATGPASATPVTISSVVSSVDATAVNTSSTLTISKTPTTTTLSAPTTVQYGATENLTATVASASATGTVAFVDTTTGTTLCAAAPISSGVATCSVPAGTPIADHALTASYSGNSAYATSTGSATTTVQKASSTIGVTASTPETSYGTPVTLTATGIPAGATGQVTFTAADGTVLCTATAATPHCQTSTTLAAARYDITANYAGDSNYLAVSSASTAPVTIDPATATITAAVNGQPSDSVSYGTAATLSAAGLASGSTGSIVFTDTASGGTLCTATLPATSCTSSATLDAGTYPVQATYSGDANHTPETSTNTATLTVTPVAAPSITASVDHPSIAFGTTATFDTAGIPSGDTGTVTYTTADGTILCTATLPATSCKAPGTVPAGSYQVTSTYSGDTDHTGATSAPIPFTVTPAEATLTASVNDGPNATTIYGAAATLDSTGLAATATGKIAYRAGTTVLCTATLPTSSCDTSAALDPGVYDITANYLGDPNHAAATSVAVELTVAKATPVLTDTVNASPSATSSYGTSATLDSTGFPAGAAGTVQYLDQHGNILCTATLPTTSCTTDDALAPGDYTVTVTYQGDDHNDPATSATAAVLHVTRAGVTTLTSTINGLPSATVVHGHSATLDTTGVPAGAIGTLTYETANGTVLCTATLPTTSCTTPANLTGGTYQVTAHYSGDANHDPAVGPTLSLRVAPQPTTVNGKSVVSTTAHTTSKGTTLTVSGLPAGATGTVTFTSGGKILCTVTLPHISCTTTALEPGSHTVVASYSGDASYAASRTTLSVTVPAAGPVAQALAFTGSEDGAAIVGGGLLLLGLGVALVIISRRRRGYRRSL